jgi:molybdopterin synthase catalytic subunit
VTVHIEVTSEPIQAWQRLEAYAGQQSVQAGKYGATAVFVGTMRDFNEGDSVSVMQLEHYPDMTRKYLDGIAARAMHKWSLLDLMIIHRVGEVKPADTLVLIAVWSAHRAEAFAACRQLMEWLKSEAPFWKKERLEDGSQRWVEKNTPG